MHNDLNYIEDLIVKFQTGLISPQELTELSEWYNSYSDEEVTIVTDEPLQKEQVRELL